MDTSKENGKRKHLPIVFYIFLVGVFMNILWLCYVKFTDPILERFLINNSVVIRDFLVQYCYPIEWITILFAIIYYVITKKKVFGFWLMIVLSITLIVLPIVMFILTWNHGCKEDVNKNESVVMHLYENKKNAGSKEPNIPSSAEAVPATKK